MNNKILYSGFAQTGTTHLKSAMVCQDKFYCKTENDFTFLSVADGSSSAKYSHLGAESVVRNAFKLIQNSFDEYYMSNPHKVKKNIINHLLKEIGIMAAKENVIVKDFATTFLFVAIKENRIIAGHVGDGLIAYRKLGKYKVLSPPQHGEFLNQTYFVTSPNFIHHFRIYKGNIEGIEEIFLMTDGVTQGYYNKKNNGLTNLFEADIKLLNDTTSSGLNKALKNFMTNKIFNQTNDDSTLVVAYLR